MMTMLLFFTADDGGAVDRASEGGIGKGVEGWDARLGSPLWWWARIGDQTRSGV